MEIILHAHHAEVSASMRTRTERAVSRLAERLRRAVHAVIRFEGDGAEKRVELVLSSPRRRPLVAEGCGKTFGPAVATALTRLEAQVRSEHAKGVRQRRDARREARRVRAA